MKNLTYIYRIFVLLLIFPMILIIGFFFLLGTSGKSTQDYLIPKESSVAYLEKQPSLVFATISTEEFLSCFSQNSNFFLKPSTEYKTQGEYPDYNLKYYIGFLQPNPHIKLWAHTTATLSVPSHVVESFFHTETENKTDLIPLETNQIAIDYFSDSAKLFFENQYHEQIDNWIKNNLTEYSKVLPKNYWISSITINSIELALFQRSLTVVNSKFVWWRSLRVRKIPPVNIDSE